MMLFSERIGINQVRDSLQIDEMDEALRTSMYNVVYLALDPDEHYEYAKSICETAWMIVLHEPINKFGYYPVDFLRYIGRYFQSCDWNEVYDLMEFLAKELPECYRNDFIDNLNIFLKNDGSGYRFADGMLVAITDDVELAELERSLRIEEPYSGSRMHMRAAVEALSARPDQDLRNAVTEAISAVESAAKVAVNDENATLGKALGMLGEERKLHPALVEGWKKIYGFASDEGGLRHGATTDHVNLDFALAKYLVVSCAAFVNYFVASQVLER